MPVRHSVTLATPVPERKEILKGSTMAHLESTRSQVSRSPWRSFSLPSQPAHPQQCAIPATASDDDPKATSQGLVFEVTVAPDPPACSAPRDGFTSS